ncbi:uncharacterized protein [Typha latifolia]|uniref:uncharacterized protein n=1 Tax=Typha latifolia TaxID=4733 RepID=UPI003C307171
MEKETIDLQDWEFLLGSDGEKPKPFKDVFATESDDNSTKLAISDEGQKEEKGGIFDSGSPSWINSESDKPKGELCPEKDEILGGGFVSDELFDARVVDSVEIHREDVEKDTGFEGVGEIESGEEAKMGNREIGSTGGGEKRGIALWKLPLEVFKYVFRVKPVWSISLAAAVLGFLLLGRRLYRLKQKSRGIPSATKLSLDEKKEFQLKSHAAHLNEAFLVARRAPIVGALQLSSGLLPWPVVGFY